MKITTQDTPGFCALEYRPQGSAAADSTSSKILILIVRTPQKTARVLVDPGWQSIIDLGDWEYMVGLVADFKSRAMHDPDALLKQTSALSVGPLITHSTGAELSGQPELLTLSQSFMEI